MPRITLPGDLALRPFLVGHARQAGISESRLRGPDLARPFHGVRAPIRPDQSEISSGLEGLSIAQAERARFLARCGEYLPRLTSAQFFSHETAARIWGMPLPQRWHESDPLHVATLAPGRAPRSAGISGHQVNSDRTVTRYRGTIPTLDAMTAWLQLAPTVSLDELIALGDYLVRIPPHPDPLYARPFCSPADLATLTGSYSGRGSTQAVEALNWIREGSDSPRETALRLLLMRAQLPEPHLNVKIFDAGGRFLGRGDLVFPEFTTLVEYDGDQHRTDPQQYERDMTRIDAFIDDGWRVVRVRSRGLATGRQETIGRVARALRAGGWQG